MAKIKDTERATGQAVFDAAREEFDLGAVLRARSIRTKTVRVFTDEETGARLGGAEPEFNQFNIATGGLRTWGVIGKIAELKADNDPDVEGQPGKAGDEKHAKEIAALKKEVVALAEVLESTALEVTLQSIPPEVKKGVRRATKKALGINEKITESHSRWDDFVDEYDAQTLVQTVVSVKNNATGQTNKGISVESARALKGYLPETEYGKITVALNELLWQRVIADKAVEDADF